MRRRPATSYQSCEDGFSLIEVIVGLAILSIIMGILAGGVQASRNVLGFIERMNAANAVLPAQSFLRSALAQTSLSTLAVNTDNMPGLQGDSTHFHIKTFYAMRGQAEGFYHLDVHLEQRKNSPAFDLVAVQSPVRPPPADGEAFEVPSLRLKLAANVRAVHFEYFGTSDGQSGDWQWFDSWSATDRLPRLVRVDVTLAPGEAQLWRRLEFPLQLAE